MQIPGRVIFRSQLQFPQKISIILITTCFKTQQETHAPNTKHLTKTRTAVYVVYSKAKQTNKETKQNKTKNKGTIMCLTQ